MAECRTIPQIFLQPDRIPMLDFDVQRCTRHCAASDRELQAGETFYSVLNAEGADVIRQDYSAEAWQGPPENCLGWWKSTMPNANSKKMNWAPNDVMLHLFEQTLGAQEQADMSYVLALLLIRRKLAKLETTETQECGTEVLKLYCPRKEMHYDVAVSDPTPSRAQEIQEQLAHLLFANSS
ncbi:MAG TPA: hypothetical protein DCY79_00740 [Planctomycetaceae bacterium]|nr:hypothetical protein [Planctomycetaceae bacterium]|tara:strand:+ start:370 stop:912 length:543 start_codon:yes stop_codon:yes gene_type:complete